MPNSRNKARLELVAKGIGPQIVPISSVDVRIRTKEGHIIGSTKSKPTGLATLECKRRTLDGERVSLLINNRQATEKTMSVDGKAAGTIILSSHRVPQVAIDPKDFGL